MEAYRVEFALPFLSSSFCTHGLATWAVLLSGWILACTVIDGLARFSTVVRASKLQADTLTDDPRLRALAKRVVIRNWITVLAQTVVFAPLLKLAFPLEAQRGLSWAECAGFWVVWAVSNDFIFTVFHTAFHEYPWLYKLAHKEHHTWKACFVWMSHAMSPYELAANGISVMFWPLVHALVLGRPTPLVLVWGVQLVSQVIGCVEHSGYDALHPLVLLNPAWFPAWFLSTTKHHDDHHRHFKGNYGGYLHIWDVLMQTELGAGGRTTRNSKAKGVVNIKAG